MYPTSMTHSYHIIMHVTSGEAKKLANWPNLEGQFIHTPTS